ncbi:MAG: DUF3343 domain-containing protein [Oscillospiraceae bacterium]|nr:DUF3343 domain-containing protein [Candidatus Equicaccousia limihippi]
MKGEKIMIGSVTYTLKAQKILHKHGYKAKVIRTYDNKKYGCGYGLITENGAENLLYSSGIKILDIIKVEQP